VPCGWVLAYVESIASTYAMTLRAIFFALPLPAGLALIEARAARINPRASGGFIDRAIWTARDQCRAEIERTHHILP